METSTDKTLKPYHVKNSLSDPTLRPYPISLLQDEIRDYLQKDKEKKLPKLKLQHSRDVSFLRDVKLSKANFNPIPLPKTLAELKNLNTCRSFGQLEISCAKNSSAKNLINSRDTAGGSVRYLEGLNNTNVSGRKEAENLLNWFNSMKGNFEHEAEFELVIWKCAEELCRQIMVECRERGELFKVIFGYFQKMFDSKNEEISDYCENIDKVYKKKINQLHISHLEEMIEYRSKIAQLEKSVKEYEEIVQETKKELVLYKKKLFKICKNMNEKNKKKKTEIGFSIFNGFSLNNYPGVNPPANFNLSSYDFGSENLPLSVQILDIFKEKITQTDWIEVREQSSQYEKKGLVDLEIEKVYEIHFEPLPIIIKCIRIDKSIQVNFAVSAKHELKRSNNLRLLSYKTINFENTDRMANSFKNITSPLLKKSFDSKEAEASQSDFSESESNISIFREENGTEAEANQEDKQMTKKEKEENKDSLKKKTEEKKKKGTNKKNNRFFKGKSAVSQFNIRKKRKTDVLKINILPENLNSSIENKEITHTGNFRKKSNSFLITTTPAQDISESQDDASLKQNNISPTSGKSRLSLRNFQIPLNSSEFVARRSSISIKRSILKTNGVNHSFSFHDESELSNDESLYKRPMSPNFVSDPNMLWKRNSNIHSSIEEFSFNHRKKSAQKSSRLKKLLMKFLNSFKKNKKFRPTFSLKNIRKVLCGMYSNLFNEDILGSILFDFNHKYGLKKVTNQKFLEFLFSAFKYKEKKICKMFLRIVGFGELIGSENLSEFGKNLYLELYMKIIINRQKLASFNENSFKYYVNFSKFCDYFKLKYEGSFPEEGIKKLLDQKYGELVGVDKLLDDIIKIHEKYSL